MHHKAEGTENIVFLSPCSMTNILCNKRKWVVQRNDLKRRSNSTMYGASTKGKVKPRQLPTWISTWHKAIIHNVEGTKDAAQTTIWSCKWGPEYRFFILLWNSDENFQLNPKGSPSIFLFPHIVCLSLNSKH